jgi:hypothetical protein
LHSQTVSLGAGVAVALGVGAAAEPEAVEPAMVEARTVCPAIAADAEYAPEVEVPVEEPHAAAARVAIKARSRIGRRIGAWSLETSRSAQSAGAGRASDE